VVFPANGKETEMRKRGEGVCRFCLKTFSGSAIGRHLRACKEKKERDVEETARSKKSGRIFHIRILGGGEYWLHVEIKALSTFSVLDQFLRDVWLECCGHISRFIIDRQSYMPSDDDDPWEIETKLMGVKLGDVLDVKDSFEYEYDFGSTTYLKGQIIAERHGALKEKVRILARNRPPEDACSECGKPADQFCAECQEFYCHPCLCDHGCEEEMALPVVNSPRMGVCGYTGHQDPDDLEPKAEDPEKATKKRELPENLKRYLEERGKKNNAS
jgi:hypothetical protein